MKKIRFGDILTVERGIIVHGCNAQGVMASGIAKQIKDKWPGCFDTYSKALRIAQHTLGIIIPYQVSSDLIIVNAVTQEYYGKDKKKYVSYWAINEVFIAIANIECKMQLGVHYPLIGAGLGGGDWSIISDIIESQMTGLNHTLWIYE